jgi:hypothetical protein
MRKRTPSGGRGRATANMRDPREAFAERLSEKRGVSIGSRGPCRSRWLSPR